MLAKNLKEIRAKEKKADEQIREARVRAEEIIAKAAEDGKSRIEDVITKKDEEKRGIVKEAGEKAESEINALRGENKKMIELLEKGADKNYNQAVDIILDAFLEQ